MASNDEIETAADVAPPVGRKWQLSMTCHVIDDVVARLHITRPLADLITKLCRNCHYSLAPRSSTRALINWVVSFSTSTQFRIYGTKISKKMHKLSYNSYGFIGVARIFSRGGALIFSKSWLPFCRHPQYTGYTVYTLQASAVQKKNISSKNWLHALPGGALTTYPYKLRHKFFLALGAHVHPVQPWLSLYGLGTLHTFFIFVLKIDTTG